MPTGYGSRIVKLCKFGIALISSSKYDERDLYENRRLVRIRISLDEDRARANARAHARYRRADE